jgi:GGDEF domain-containing protein
MHVFDRIDAATLERRDWQLWALAMVCIFILTVGMALLMYPTVLASSEGPGGVILRRSFFGFCVLCLLLEVYLLDRQLVIRQLRRRLVEEQRQKVRILEQAGADLLGSLPGFAHFQDRLAMEFRRAANIHQPLSLLMVGLRHLHDVSDAGGKATVEGDAAKVLIRKLRGEDSIYLFHPGVFAIVLPGVRGLDANRVAERLQEGLTDAAGAGNRFAAEIRMINYPEHASTARELEQMAVRCFPGKLPQAEAAGEVVERG